MTNLTQEQVVDAVSRHLKEQHPGGADLTVFPDGIRHEQEWWYVPVQPSVQPPRRYEYYEALAAVETALLKAEGVTVLLVPTPPEAEQEAA